MFYLYFQPPRKTVGVKKSSSVFNQTLYAVYTIGAAFILCFLIALIWEFLYYKPKMNRNTVTNIKVTEQDNACNVK